MNPSEVADRIRPYVRRTPVLRAEVDGRPLVLKLEHLQRTGVFKFRGAVNALLADPGPVVTASGGNHGLAVAVAAQTLGVPATVYVPEAAPAAKTSRIEAAGAKLIRVGATYNEAADAARAAAGDALYLPAYDHPDVIAGQATCALEVVQDAPDVDAFIVAAGGGGLAAGTVLAAGDRPVVIVEPEHCRSTNAALEAGEPVDVEVDSIAASALGTVRVGTLPFEVLKAAGVRSLLVSDAEIVAAQDRMWEEFRLAVEPAGAVPLAAWLRHDIDAELPCLVVCGANSDWVRG